MAAMMSGSKGRQAAYSVREMLIPWVEQSSLSKADRQNIVERLTDLSAAMEQEGTLVSTIVAVGVAADRQPCLSVGSRGAID